MIFLPLIQSVADFAPPFALLIQLNAAALCSRPFSEKEHHACMGADVMASVSQYLTFPAHWTPQADLTVAWQEVVVYESSEGSGEKLLTLSRAYPLRITACAHACIRMSYVISSQRSIQRGLTVVLNYIIRVFWRSVIYDATAHERVDPWIVRSGYPGSAHVHADRFANLVACLEQLL